MRPRAANKLLPAAQAMSRLLVRLKTSKENKRSRALTLGNIPQNDGSIRLACGGRATKATSMQSIEIKRGDSFKRSACSQSHTNLSRVQTTDRYATYLLKEDGNILLAGLCLLGCLPVGVGGGLAVVVHAVHLCCFAWWENGW